ncbi:MAG TPA: pyridoxamine 5'-phosphate oxidase family protein [Acholeplasmataceae bacterium]|nr:pyridoxamine 5'-phosphate oxidase family protein [Acholeplasmataceae bacterium]
MQEIQNILDHFTEGFKSVSIASLTQEGTPYISYAPFVKYENNYYIIISKMAKHYHNLRENPDASIMLIEDEHQASSIFFRKRLSYEVVARFEESTPKVIEAFKERHGHMIDQLLTLDFFIVNLKVKKGLLVLGPGKAFMVDDCEHIIDQAGRGQGHQK